MQNNEQIKKENEDTYLAWPTLVVVSGIFWDFVFFDKSTLTRNTLILSYLFFAVVFPVALMKFLKIDQKKCSIYIALYFRYYGY